MASTPQDPENSNPPAKETPAKETPAGETPAGETPAGETPTGETPLRKTDNSNMYSGRMPDKWFDLVEILKARKQPGQKIGDLLTETLERGMEKEEESKETATVITYPTLDGSEYIKIKGILATISNTLISFRADLLQIDQYPDDEQRTIKLVELYERTEAALESIKVLQPRISRISRLPALLEGTDLIIMRDFSRTVKHWDATATPEEKPIYTLLLKLLAPYLP